MAKVLKDFQRRLAKVEIHRKNKATTIRLVAAFPPILPYDEWEAKLTKTTKHAKRHFWLNDVCTCHGLLPSHSA